MKNIYAPWICAIFLSSSLFANTGPKNSNPTHVSNTTMMNEETQFFASSNTQALIGVFDVDNMNGVMMSSFASLAGDADGIYYDEASDVLYQLNRTDNVINAYSNVSTSPSLTATSTSDFSNGREIAVVGTKLIVAQDAAAGNNDQNAFFVYDISPTSITLDKVHPVSINLWGIHLNGTTLYAVVDNSNQLAVFNDFFANAAGMISPDQTVSIENLVRTHGITYDADEDLMILTDVGDAASATDGALITITNFTAKSADDMISAGEQARVSGGASQLGNPVDIAYHKANRRVYVAERANGGGRILGFKLPNLTGGIAPVYNVAFAGASAIYLVSIPPVVCDGGTVAFTDGTTSKTIFIDGVADNLSFSATADPVNDGYDFTYVVTDDSGIILGIPGGNTVDFDPAGIGNCKVYGLSYTGNLNISMGDNLLEMGLVISDGCYDLSSNSLTVVRIAPVTPDAQFYVSSNTSATIGVYDIINGNNTIVMSSFNSVATDADGIYVTQGGDVMYQLNRTDNVINAYSNLIDSLAVGADPLLTATSSSDFSNGREIAVRGDKLIVAQDAAASNGDQNAFIIYNISPTSITLDKTLTVSINLWGIHISGNTLYAVVDNSNQIAVFNNFFDNAAGAIVPNTTVSVDNLVRTHGLTYDAEADLMILTDVGDAASATDGALITIKNFTTASADGTISASEQARVSGGASRLGNPVDVAYDKENNRVYVAERANGGGRILGFKFPNLTGGIAPFYNQLFAGASAIHLPGLDCNFVDGGTVAFSTGGTSKTIFIDGVADNLSFTSTADPMTGGYSFTYVITDDSGNILGIPGGSTVDFDPAGVGNCKVYGLSYTGNLNIGMGDNLLTMGLILSDGCYELSSNSLTVVRVMSMTPDAQFFASSNTSATVGVFSIIAPSTVVATSFASVATDADGIYYDEANDVLYQLNRTDNVINAYSNVSDSLAVGGTPVLTATSTSDFSNGREIAVNGTKLVVVQDAAGSNGDQNAFVIYDISPTSITLDKTYTVSINLWGVHLNGTTLYAVEDQSNRVAVYNDFFANAAGPLTEDMLVAVDNLVRTHGITYDGDSDMMILTDIGDAASATDGAIVVIKNFTTAGADGTVDASEQARVFGGASQLGNPVDIAFDKSNRRVYVAERARDGGKILGFKLPNLTGGIAPIYSQLFPGASAIQLPNNNSTFTGTGGGASANSDNGNTEDVQPVAVTSSKLYPVPTTSMLNLELESITERTVTVGIFDSRGAMVQSAEIALVKGTNTFRFEVDGLSNGVHFVRIPELGITQRFVKINQ